MSFAAKFLLLISIIMLFTALRQRQFQKLETIREFHVKEK